MAGNRQEFTYAINADTSKAKKQIADLFKSLDKVQKFSLDNFDITPDLVNASRAAEELATHLRAATNVNTGQLNLAKFNQSIRGANTSLGDLISDLSMGGSAGQSAFEQITAAIARTQVPLRQTSALLKDMATTLKNTIKWELSSTAVHGLESALSGAVSYAKNLNTSLTNIRIVTGQSVEDMARFTKEANAAAKALSTTTKSYADASLIYYQQGDSQEMAAKKAAITIKAANASFETSAKEMSEYLTSVWNSYQVGADELERYVDIMANLGAKTATSLEEIATSMQKVAATSNTVGVSMEQVSSIIATVSSVTRESAESIGTSYKTIFARIGDLKLGKADEDGIGLGQVSSHLDAIGVKILDESGNLREMGDIIMDLGTKWQTMNQAQKTAVAQVVAGKRQYTQLMALFENWDMFQANLNLAENSEGALQGMADIYAESWEAASARVQASMESIFNSMINDQGLIKLTNFTSDFVDGIGGAIDSIGGLNGVLRLTGSILLKTFSKEAGARIKELGNSIKNIFIDPKTSHKNALDETRKELSSLDLNKAQIDAQIDLIDAKQQLLGVEEYLTTAQKQNAQAALQGLEEQANKVKQVEDEYLELKKAMELSDFSQKQHYNEQVREKLKQQDFGLESVKISETKNLDSFLHTYKNLLATIELSGTSFEKLDGNFGDIKDQTRELQKEAQNLKYAMTELGVSIDNLSADDLDKLISKKVWDTTDIDNLKNAFKALGQAAKNDSEKMEQALRSLALELQECGDEGQAAGVKLEALLNELGQSDDPQILANKIRALTDEVMRLKRGTENFKDNIDPEKMGFNKLIESVFDLGGGALDLINGGAAVGELIADWGDQSISTARKMGTLLSSMMELGMGGVSIFKGMVALGAGNPVAAGIAAILTAVSAISGVTSGIEESNKKDRENRSQSLREKTNNQKESINEQTNNLQTLINTYNELYAKQQQGEDVENELLEVTSELANAYNITGAAVAAATGNFDDFNNALKNTLNISDLIKENTTGLNSAQAALENNMIQPTVPYSKLGEGIIQSNSMFDPTATIDTIDEFAYKRMGLDRANQVDLTTLSIEQWKTLLSDGHFYNSLLKTFEADLGKEKAKSYGIERIPMLGGYVSSAITAEEAKYIVDNELQGKLSMSTADILKNGREAHYVNKESLKTLGVNPEDFIDFLQLGQGKLGEGLLNNDGIVWDNDASAEWKVDQFDKLTKWEEELLRLRSETTDKFLKTTLDSVIGAVQSVTHNEGLKTDVENVKLFKKREAQLGIIQKDILSNVINATLDNTTFEAYSDIYNQVASSIDNNQDAFIELKDLEQGSTEYIQARDKLVTQMINDYSALDDYSLIYSTLVDSFEGEDLAQAIALVSGKGIKSLSTTLLNALTQVVTNGMDESIIEDIIAADEATINAQEAQKEYTKRKEASKSMKENMDVSDAQNLYDQFWNAGIENIMAWEEFVALDYEARENYIKTLVDESATSAQESADLALEKAEAAKKTWDESMATLYGDAEGRAEWDSEAELYKEFLKDRDTHFIKQEDGNYKYDGQGSYDYSWELSNGMMQGAFENWQRSRLTPNEDGEITGGIITTSTEEIEKYIAAVQQGQDLQGRVDSAEAMAHAYDLIGTSAEKTATKLTRLNNAIKSMPTDIKELKDVAKQLKMGEDDESLLKLINMTELERAQAVLNNITPPDPSKFADLGLYNEALQEYKALMENATSVVMAEADKAMARFEARLEALKKTAAEEQQKADILAASVQDGKISSQDALELESLGITTEAWAAYSVEVRAATAAKQTYAAAAAAREALEAEQTILKESITYWETYGDHYASSIDNDTKFRQNLLASKSHGNLTDEQAAKIMQARNRAIEEGYSGQAAIERMAVLLDLDSSDLEKQLKGVAASTKDDVADIFKGLSDEIKQRAQEAVDAWVSAFDTIAEARKTLLEGGSLIDQLAGDPKKIQEVFANFDGTWEEFMQGIMDGSLDVNKLATPQITESYLQDKYAAAGVSSLTGSREEQLAQARKTLEAQVKPGETVEDEAVIAKVAQDYETAIRGLVEQGLINMSDDQIKADAMALAKGEHAMGDALVEAINAYLTQAQERIDFSEQLRVEKQQRQEDAIAISEAAEIDQTEYDKQIRLQEALDAARAVKKDNGDWEDIDSKNRSILEANGITGLEQVDSAAVQCASALASLAEAAYNAAKSEAEAKGYSQNEAGEWGIQHTATMTEEEGRNLYGGDWDQYKAGLTDLGNGLYQYDTNFEVVDEINDLMQETNERMKELKGSMEDLPTDLWEEEMEGFGLDPDEVDELGDSIQEMAESSDELADSLKHDAEAADEVAKELKRYGNAVEDVEDNYKDWMKALQSDDLTKQTKTIKQLDKAYSDMLDLDYGSLSKDFLSNAENLELMKKAAEGSEEAYDELAQKAGEDILMQVGIDKSRFEWDKNQVDNWCQEINGKSLDDIEVGASLDNADFLNALSEMVSAAGMTADQATSYLASMGIDAEVETQQVPETQIYAGAIAEVEPKTGSYQMPMEGGGSGEYIVPSVTYTPQPLPVEGTKTATALKVTSANKSSGGGFKHKNSGGGGGGKGGGGGSKPAKKEKKPHKRYKDETERYHKNNETLSRISEELDKIDKFKERAYGAKHLKAIDAETAALKEQINAQQALYDEAMKYAAADQIAVAKYGAEFDADGTITNYEEAIATANEAMNNLLETQNQISELETEKITY